MALKYPIDCITPAERTEYCYRAQELLRLMHNCFSKWYRESLTQIQYGELPQKLKTKYPYGAKLIQKDWDKFLKEDFLTRSDTICTGINIQRAEMKKSTTWDIKVEDI